MMALFLEGGVVLHFRVPKALAEVEVADVCEVVKAGTSGEERWGSE